MPLETEQSNRIRLMHMREAAIEALSYSRGRPQSDLTDDSMYRRAVTSCIQEIGEAATQVSSDFRERVPEIPWKDIVKMRNVIVHSSFDVRLTLIWEVLSLDLQPLLMALQGALN